MTDSVIDIGQYKFDQAEIELRKKLVEYSECSEIRSQIGEAFYIWKDDPDFTEEEITEDNIDDPTFEKFFDWFLYDFKLLDTGERVIERFYREAKETLSETEESIIMGWLDSVYSFYEVDEAVPGEYCSISDLILKGEIIVRDSSSSKKLKRTDIIGARPLKAGGNTYFSGVISVYPSAFRKLIIDYFESEYKEYRKAKGPGRNKKECLRDWGFHISNYAEDLANNPKLITSRGEELVLATATYLIKDASEVKKRISSIKSLKQMSRQDDEIVVFSVVNDDGGEISGSLEIMDNIIRIESHSQNMLNKAKSLIERDLEGHIEHLEDQTKGPELYIKQAKREKLKLKKLPPGINSLKELEKKLDKHYSDWIDQPLHALNGKTPREAAKTTKGRKDLNLVLNELESLYKHAKLRDEPFFDVNILRRKLNLE